MPVGIILLLIISILIFLGLAQRVLDRLGLTDRTALLFIAAMLVGGFLPDIPLSGTLAINIGGWADPHLSNCLSFHQGRYHHGENSRCGGPADHGGSNLHRLKDISPGADLCFSCRSALLGSPDCRCSRLPGRTLPADCLYRWRGSDCVERYLYPR